VAQPTAQLGFNTEVLVFPLYSLAGGVASVGERVTFSSPNENAHAGETAPMFQYQPTLATPLVTHSFYFFLKISLSCLSRNNSYNSFVDIVFE